MKTYEYEVYIANTLKYIHLLPKKRAKYRNKCNIKKL